jgi:hypothetical protein
MAETASTMDIERHDGRAPWVAGLAAAGATGTALLLARRRRKREKPVDRVQHRAAEMAQNLPDRWADTVSERMDDTKWRIWAVTAAGLAWLLFRMAEMRQLRRMNRSLKAA